MDSYYFLIHGEHPTAKAALNLLELTRSDFGRWRDGGLGNGGIWALARIGGPNRKGYQSKIDALMSHKLFISLRDLSTDPTYMEILFRFPTTDELCEENKEAMAFALQAPGTPKLPYGNTVDGFLRTMREISSRPHPSIEERLASFGAEA